VPPDSNVIESNRWHVLTHLMLKKIQGNSTSSLFELLDHLLLLQNPDSTFLTQLKLDEGGLAITLT
jgi:hypothetical protein